MQNTINSKPIIAYDIDGVAIDWFAAANNFVNQNNLVSTQLDYEELADHDLCNQWGITVIEMSKIMDLFYQHNPIETLPVIPGAADIINRLAQHFNTLFITARRDSLAAGTITCLNRHITASHEIYFSLGAKNPHGGGNGRKAKQEIAEEKGAICLIEDNPHEIIEWTSKTVEIICHARPWNRFLPDNIRLTWPQIEIHLMEKYALTQTN